MSAEESDKLALDRTTGLEIARNLVRMGVPVFRAPGMQLPTRWQHTEPGDDAAVMQWQPGDGLAAVMGHAFDAIDVDPRNGGDPRILGAFTTYGQQATPRGGVHGLIAPLRVGKHQNVLPGVDLQGGRLDGTSRGFIWIAPTVRHGNSYSWVTDPRRRPAGVPDDSGTWLVDMLSTPAAEPAETAVAAPATDPPPPGYLDAFWADVAAYVTAEPGTGDTTLLRLACRVREFANAGWLDLVDGLNRLDDARERRIDQHPNGGGQDETDWRRIVRSSRNRVGSKSAVRAERTELQVGGKAVSEYAPKGSAAGSGSQTGSTPALPAGDAVGGSTPGRLKLVKASSIKMKRVRWLRHERIPVGEITLVAGREGTGKSIYLAHLAAKITQGDARGEFDGRKRGVMYVASEDSWAHTVAPRMLAAGADMDLIYNVEVAGGGSLTLPGDTEELVSVARQGDVGAIMLDPIVSLIDPKYSTDRARELRMAIEPLRKAAEEIEAAVLALVHFNKNEGDVLTKIAGSRGWVEVARAVLGIAKDDDAEHLVISQIKNNLGRLDLPNWAFVIHSHQIKVDDGAADTGRLEWTKKVESGVADLLGQKQGRGRPTQGRDHRAVASWIEGECAADDLDALDTATIQRRLGEIEGWSLRTTQGRLKLAVDSGLLREIGKGRYGPLD